MPMILSTFSSWRCSDTSSWITLHGGDFLRKIVEHVLRQPIRKILRHIAAVVGGGAGLEALDGDAAVRIRTGMSVGRFK